MTKIVGTLFFVLVAFAACNKKSSQVPGSMTQIQVYTYDSFTAKGGLGEWVSDIPGCHVKLTSVGDGAQIVSQLQLDRMRNKSVAQLALGFDQTQVEALSPFMKPLPGGQPQGYMTVSPAIQQAISPAIAFDYGPLSLMTNEPLKYSSRMSLRDLLHERYRKKLIFEDPRTSTPGAIFVGFLQEMLRDDAEKFLIGLRKNFLTVAPGWDLAYGLFLKREAPFVWSYLTSQAYHEFAKEPGYKAVLFTEGQPIQVEGAAFLGGTQEQETCVKNFLDVLLSETVQSKIPRTNWMYPARADVALPAEFLSLPKVGHTVMVKSSSDSIRRIWAKVQ